MKPAAAPRWVTTTTRLAIGTLQLDLSLLDGFEANVAHDVARRRGRPDRRPGADIAPMFGVLWPGARAVSEALLNAPILDGTRVLELGCGLAVPSLVAAARGADVVATDVHPDAGELLVHNLRRNADALTAGRVTWARWDWRDAPPAACEGLFDRVVASDVLYDGLLAEPLADTFARTLAPHGVGWLTDPGRPWLDEFATAARARGLQVAEEVVERGEDVVFWLTLTWRSCGC